MRTVTLCLAYYENAGMLAAQVAALAALPAELREYIAVIVVDDGSPTAPARLPDIQPCPMRLYRMREDIPWNQDACRNLAVAEAPDGWVLLTDMDHVPTEKLWRRILHRDLDPSCAYTFARVSAPKMDPYKPHPNSWLMTRRLFQQTGGYDERYRGVYGTDGIFKRRLEAHVASIVPLKEALIRYPREVIADASTTTLARKSPENDARKAEVRTKIQESGVLAPARGLTAWDRIA